MDTLKQNSQMQTSSLQEDSQESINIMDFCLTLLSHWYWIVLTVVIALCVAVIKIKSTTPTYTRSMSLLIKSDDGKSSGSLGSSMSQEFQNLGIIPSNTNINNEIQTISAVVMMQEVVKRLHLDVQMEVEEGMHKVPLYDNSPITLLLPQASDKYMCRFKMQLRKNQTAELWDFEDEKGVTEKRITVKMGQLARTPIGYVIIQPTQYWQSNFTDSEIYVSKNSADAMGNMYASRLNVALSDKESTIINLSMADESIKRADDILMKLVDVYNEQWLKDKNRVAESTSDFIVDRLNNLSKELSDVDQKISDYKSEVKVPDVDAASTLYMNESSRNNDQILTLQNQLGVARYIREYLADHSKANQYLPTNTGIGSTGIEKMIAEYNKNLSARNDLLINTNESNPLVQKYNTDLAMQRQTIMHSLDNLLAQLKSQVALWENTESQTNQKLATAPQQVKKLLSVGRQQKVKEALYIYLLQKREENELSKTYTAWNTRIIQPPMGSDYPSSPRSNMILLIAIALGAAIPIGILFLRESLNKTVRGRADLDGMQVPMLAEIPALAKKAPWFKRDKKDMVRDIYVKENSRDLINESFRILRTKLDYFMANKGKIVMLTSFNPGSGKSFIAMNLGKVLSLKNKRVLVIDFDLRRALLSEYVNSPKQGFTSYACGMIDNVHDVIVHDCIAKGADILPVGVIPPNPAELLLSDKLKGMFDELRNEYDYIIIDCPPVDIVTDTNIVKQFADTTLFVVRAGLMDRRILKDVDELYMSNTYKNMAILLNGAPYVSSKYGSYRYGYGYGYGHNYFEKDKR